MKINIVSLGLLALVAVIISLTSSPLIVLSILLVIVLPGYTIVNFLKLSTVEKLILSVGTGIAFIAFLTYLLKFIPIPINTFTTYAIMFLSLLFLVHMVRPRLHEIQFTRKLNILHVALIFVLFVGLFTRIYPIKDLNAPLFTDPAAESLIAQLIVNNNGIPETLEPFLPVELRHQPGFASVIAWIHMFSGLPIPEIVLFFTNIIQGLIPLTIYFVAFRLLKNEYQSAIAAIIALMAAFPTYIFIAGMNTGLAMYFLLFLIVGLSFHILEKDSGKKEIVLLFVLLSGSFLLHPTLGFFYLLFLAPYIALKTRSISKLVPIAVPFIASILFIFPYFLPSLSGSTATLAEEQWNLQTIWINPDKSLSPLLIVEPIFTFFDNSIGFWFIYLEEVPLSQFPFLLPTGIALSILFALSIYTIYKKRHLTGTVALTWFLALVFLSSFQSALQIPFPGWTFIYVTRVKWLLVLPLSLILSYAFAHSERIFKKVPIMLVLLLVVLVPSSLTIMNHLSELSSERATLTDNDLAAINWLKENTEKNDVILNSITFVETGAFIPDSGQWIPPLANRQVIFPPSSLTEDVTSENIVKRIEIMEMASAGDVNSAEFIDLLKEYNVNYIYITGTQVGFILQTFDLPSPDIFSTDIYETRFSAGSTTILEVVR